MITTTIPPLTSELIKNSTLYPLLSNLGSCEKLHFWPQNNDYYNDLPITKKDIPELINLACNLEFFSSKLEEKLWIPVHAWRILGNFAATEAIKPLIDCFSKYYRYEFATEELPSVFSKIGPVAIEDLTNHLYNPHNSEDSKILATEAIGEIALNHDSYHEECIDILANFLEQPNNNFRALNGIIIGVLQALKAVSKITNIRHAFNRDIVDLRIVGDIEDVEIALNLRQTRETVRAPLFPFFEFFEDIENEYEPMPVRSVKIGRNEICFCGSGKKYKKCCINQEFGIN